MSSQVRFTHGVMEGQGAYNRHAKLQASGASLALPFLQTAIQNIVLDSGDRPVVVADYGSSQGKNSLIPMRAAVQGLRKRVGADRPISVFHIDQPSNDFNSLFGVLHEDPDSYTVNDPKVYPSAIGKSFYEKVLPSGSVHLGWSSYAAMWLSRLPALLPDHFIPHCSKAEARHEFDRQAAEDWEAFLWLRANELCLGGRLIVVLPGIADDGLAGFEPLFDQANEVLEEMVSDGAITSEERGRMTVMSHPRRERELLRPFQPRGEFHGLVVEDCKMCTLADVAWKEYVRSGDERALAAGRAGFIRSAFLPSFACALNHSDTSNGDAVKRFADQLERRLVRRLAIHPAPVLTLAQVMVFAKKV